MRELKILLRVAEGLLVGLVVVGCGSSDGAPESVEPADGGQEATGGQTSAAGGATAAAGGRLGQGGSVPAAGGAASTGGRAMASGGATGTTGGATASGGALTATGGGSPRDTCTPGTVWEDGCDCSKYVTGDKHCNASGTYDACECLETWGCAERADSCDCKVGTRAELDAAGYTKTSCSPTWCCALHDQKCECYAADAIPGATPDGGARADCAAWVGRFESVLEDHCTF